MKRTQIYLPEDLHEMVRRLAFEQRRSMADVIREAVASYMAEQPTQPSQAGGNGNVRAVRDFVE